MEAPITILAEIPEHDMYIVGSADGKIQYTAGILVTDLHDCLKQDAIKIDAKRGDKIRLPLPMAQSIWAEVYEQWLTDISRWGWKKVQRTDMPFEEVTIHSVKLSVGYELLCGFAPKLRKWVVSGELVRI